MGNSFYLGEKVLELEQVKILEEMLDQVNKYIDAVCWDDTAKRYWKTNLIVKEVLYILDNQDGKKIFVDKEDLEEIFGDVLATIILSGNYVE